LRNSFFSISGWREYEEIPTLFHPQVELKAQRIREALPGTLTGLKFLISRLSEMRYTAMRFDVLVLVAMNVMVF
jgi:hypothetical protein